MSGYEGLGFSEEEARRRSDAVRRLAFETFHEMMGAAIDAKLDWPDVVVACASLLGIMACASAEQTGASDPKAFADKIVEGVAEGARLRIAQRFPTQ